MNTACVIDVDVASPGWTEVCPAVRDLAREAAGLALAHGTRALGLEWERPVELGITMTDAAQQQRLNRDFRGRDNPTNVLAFTAWEAEAPLPPGAPILLGDVVLALEIVANEALEQNKLFDNHVSHLVVHGVLHLLGFDDVAEAERVAMELLETSILAELGVSDPYHDTILFVEPPAPLP